MTEITKAPGPNTVPQVPEEPVLNVAKPAPDRTDEFGSLTDVLEESARMTTRIPTSVSSALTQTGVGFGVGYGVSKLYQ